MISKVLCSAYIFFVVGITAGAVGDMPRQPPEPFPFYLPFLVFGMMAIPAILGYTAGKDECQE